MKHIWALPPIVVLAVSAMPALAKDGIYVAGLSKCLTDDQRLLNCGGEATCDSALLTCSYAGIAGTFVPARTGAKKVEIKRKK